MDLPSIEKARKKLIGNGFNTYICETPTEAKELFFSRIFPGLTAASVSYGDSITLKETGILEKLKKDKDITFIDTFDKTKTWEERLELRRQALLVDLFLTGSNAITENGQIINLDMIGNRINGIVFGPRNVLLTVGKNKIVKDIAEGMKRIKETAAPMNAARHKDFILACQKAGRCVDCSGEKRICNVWSIIEKCYPKKRINIILINKELGY